MRSAQVRRCSLAQAIAHPKSFKKLSIQRICKDVCFSVMCMDDLLDKIGGECVKNYVEENVWSVSARFI